MLRISSLLDSEQTQQVRQPRDQTSVDWLSIAEYGDVENEIGAWLELHPERVVAQHEMDELHSVFMAACEQEGVCDHITPPRVTLVGYFCFVISSNGPLRDANERLVRLFPNCDAEKGGGVVDEAEFARCVRRLGFDEAEILTLWTGLAQGRPVAIDLDDLLRQYRYPSLAFAPVAGPPTPAFVAVTGTNAPAPAGLGGASAVESSLEGASAVADPSRLLSAFLLSLAWAAHDDELRERGEHAREHGHNGVSGAGRFCMATGWVLDGDNASSVMKLLGDMLRAASKRLSVAELMELFDSDGKRAARHPSPPSRQPLSCPAATSSRPPCAQAPHVPRPSIPQASYLLHTHISTQGADHG